MVTFTGEAPEEEKEDDEVPENAWLPSAKRTTVFDCGRRPWQQGVAVQSSHSLFKHSSWLSGPSVTEKGH